MIEPALALALAVYNTPGAYALLLGSGISRTAGIPTGWDIVLDLIRQLAALRGADCEPDPAAWYHATYQEDPDYARLLDQLALTPTARQQMLRRYFAPSAEEREQGTKLPTPAHHAIAHLVAAKCIRMIITTNFDELLEQAIKDAGVTPTVISTTDALAGSLPFHLADCVIVKLHGSYTDVRIRNTPTELATYDATIDTTLDRIFDEYGLIVCGWSGDWDTALRNAITRCQTHRFPMFWMAKDGATSHQAQQLVTHRRGQIIPITGADAAFQDLSEKIDALATYTTRHPLSKEIAVETLKKYLAEDRYRIRLYDFVIEECERLCQALHNANFDVAVPQPINNDTTASELLRRLQQYEAYTEIVQSLLVYGCYWGTDVHRDLWIRCLEQTAAVHAKSTYSYPLWSNLEWYPTLLLLYAGGIAALAAQRYDTFAALLTRPIVQEQSGFTNQALVRVVYPEAVLRRENGWLLSNQQRLNTPTSDRLFTIIRPMFQHFVPDDVRFAQIFDRFEYLLALVHADVDEREGGFHGFAAPIGRFGWRYQHQIQKGPAGVIHTEIETMGQAWPPLQAGLFNGELGRLQQVEAAVQKQLQDRHW